MATSSNNKNRYSSKCLFGLLGMPFMQRFRSVKRSCNIRNRRKNCSCLTDTLLLPRKKIEVAHPALGDKCSFCTLANKELSERRPRTCAESNYFS